MARLAYNGYVDGTSARKMTAAPAAQPERKRQRQRDVRVVKGNAAANNRNAALDPQFIFGFKLVIACALVLCVFAGVRVWLSVETVQVMQGIEALQGDIEAARAAGNELEIQHSILASPTRIQKEAAKIGMVQPASVTRITVSLPPAPSYFEDGSLSLAGTLKSVESSIAGMR